MNGCPLTIKNFLSCLADNLPSAPTQFKSIDVRELLAMTFGFALALTLIFRGDTETGKTVALALVFYGIGRSVP